VKQCRPWTFWPQLCFVVLLLTEHPTTTTTRTMRSAFLSRYFPTKTRTFQPRALTRTVFPRPQRTLRRPFPRQALAHRRIHRRLKLKTTATEMAMMMVAKRGVLHAW
jgi:hypothetical protein